MTPEDCVLVSVNPDGSDASGWAVADWENTNNYNLRITIAKTNPLRTVLAKFIWNTRVSVQEISSVSTRTPAKDSL